jgi:hypothetical protein
MSERTTFDDWAQSDDTPEPDDSRLLEVWLVELAEAIEAFGPGER